MKIKPLKLEKIAGTIYSCQTYYIDENVTLDFFLHPLSKKEFIDLEECRKHYYMCRRILLNFSKN